MTEMHDVVEMLLTRMRDYPEEFVGEPDDYSDRAETKWKRALRKIKDVLNPAEKEALDKAADEAKRAVYMGAALKTMLSDEEPADVIFKTNGRYQNPFATTGVNASSQLTSTAITDSIMQNRMRGLLA